MVGAGTGSWLSGARAAVVGAALLLMGALAVLVGASAGQETGTVALAAALMLAAMLARATTVIRFGQPDVAATVAAAAVPACLVPLRNPDAPGWGSRPRAPGQRALSAR